jgi:iron complex outermembrane receptor protein
MNTISGTVLVFSALSLTPFVPAHAADDDLRIEEVVVTARKRAESLQDVPIAITAFTEQTIQRAGIERPADFIALMPNVTIVDTANADTSLSCVRINTL